MEGKSHFSNGVSGIAILRREGEGDHSWLLRAEGKAVLSSAWLLRITGGPPTSNNTGKLQLHEPRVLDSGSQKA